MSSIYELALREVARQIQAIGTTLLFSDEIEVRRLDWEDVVKLGGVTIRYDVNAIRERQDGTNERDQWGYPAYFVMTQGWRAKMEDEVPAAVDLLQNVTRYFHNKRRMSALESEGVNQMPCVVTPGPRPPAKFADKDIVTRTIWTWFLEPRSAENYVA